MPPITVLIADEQRMFADALARSLRMWSELTVIDDHPTTGQEAVDAALEHKPDTMLIDYSIGRKDMGAPAVIQTLKSTVPRCVVIVLSWDHGLQEIESALQAGAVGFLPKTLSVDRVAEAVLRARSGGLIFFPEELATFKQDLGERGTENLEGWLSAWERFRSLTRREIEVLIKLSQGRSVEELAADLSISTATARNHVHKVLKKTGTRSQLEAITLARRYKFIS